MTATEAWGLVPVSDIERAMEELDHGDPRAAQRLLEELFETASANGLLLNEAPEYRRITTARRPNIGVIVAAVIVIAGIVIAEAGARKTMAELIGVQTALTRFTLEAFDNAAEMLGYRMRPIRPEKEQEA